MAKIFSSESSAEQVKTTCPYCGIGCGVTASVSDTQVIAVSGDTSHSANAGRLCVKGSALHETFSEVDRLLHPTVEGNETTWDSALDIVAERLRDTLAKHGPESIAFYLSGQLLSEDYYVANKLMKGFLGSANVDTNSRLCMSSAVSAHKRAFGEDIVPVSYRDVETCDLLILTGSNAAWSHPVLYQRIAAAKAANPDKYIVVIDVRKTATCDIADLCLEIAPGSDGFLFSGLLRFLANTGITDPDFIERHTEGFEKCLDSAQSFSIDKVAALTQLEPAIVEKFYSLFAENPRCVTLFSQGINQSETGTDKGNAIINCHLATGRIGKPASGPFSITGQPNAMGGREVGGLANTLAAHRDFTPGDIDTVGRFWGSDQMASAPGKMAVDMFKDVGSGKIKFLWVMATNPAVSLPDTTNVRKALANCEFLVVSDCSSATDTGQYADVLLPALGWGEKDGTVTNSERVISRQRQLLPAPGNAKPDWWIINEIAGRLGFGANFSYQSPAEIFREHAALSGFENNGARAFDISALAALSDAEYADMEPIRWPCKAAGDTEPDLFENGTFFTPSARARFVAISPLVPQESTPQDLIVNTGRLRDQWHTMTRTGQVAKLAKHRDFFTVTLHPEDAQQRSLLSGDIAKIENPRGVLHASVAIDPAQPRGQLFLPIHWSEQFTSSGAVNKLLPAITDPVSGQPQLKYTTANVTKLSTPGWGLLFSREKPTLPALSYWSRIAVAEGYLTLLAHRMDPAWLFKALTLHLGMSENSATYEDAGGSDFRKIEMNGGIVQSALFLSGNRSTLPKRDWVSKAMLEPERTITEMLAGFDAGETDKGPLICSCWEVGELAIGAAIRNGAQTPEALGAALKCGTQCGSCIPELKQLLCTYST